MTDETTTITREQELAEQFKAGLAPDVAEAMGKRVSDLETQVADQAEQLTALQAETQAAIDARAAAESERNAADDVAEAMSKRMADLETQVAEQTEQLAALQADAQAAHEARGAAERERDAAEARADAATKKKGKVTAEAAPPQPRKLGPVKDAPRGDELKAAIAKADKVEIAFSDGDKEVAGIAPFLAEGDVWKDHSLGLMLRDPLPVQGPQAGGSSVPVAGYALVLDGKQVAYTQRADPLNIAPGTTVSIEDDIYF